MDVDESNFFLSGPDFVQTTCEGGKGVNSDG